MLKMQELIKLTNTPKSTILYYIKEGILPEPKKPKPNLHFYDESVVEAVEFIQYLQSKFHSSIAEIKAIFSSEKFDIKNPYESLLNVLDLTLGKGSGRSYTKDEVKKELDIDDELLEFALNEGVIYLRQGVFTQTEIELLKLLKNSTKKELKLINSYVKYASKLAKIEVKLGKTLLQKEDKNRGLKRFFDIILVLKPYIFNFKTLTTYKDEK